MKHEEEVALAKAATPGPWSWYPDGLRSGQDMVIEATHDPDSGADIQCFHADAAFIAHNSPERVLEMLEELELLRGLEENCHHWSQYDDDSPDFCEDLDKLKAWRKERAK